MTTESNRDHFNIVDLILVLCSEFLCSILFAKKTPFLFLFIIASR